MAWLQVAELIHYIVSIITLPSLIIFFVYEQRRARRNEEQSIYQSLLDQYTGFMMKVLENADLKLLQDAQGKHELNDEQQERQTALFDILITLFERAFFLILDNKTQKHSQHWAPWETNIRQWCRRDDFRIALPQLLEGTNNSFRNYILQIAKQEASVSSTNTYAATTPLVDKRNAPRTHKTDADRTTSPLLYEEEGEE